jgi:hypothetical protein
VPIHSPTGLRRRCTEDARPQTGTPARNSLISDPNTGDQTNIINQSINQSSFAIRWQAEQLRQLQVAQANAMAQLVAKFDADDNKVPKCWAFISFFLAH